MTARDQLHELIPTPRPSRGGVPAFVGSFGSGRTDISERAEEILRAELGAAPCS